MTHGNWSPTVRWALAIGCALSVGNLYFVQPLLPKIAAEFRITEGAAGAAATAGQLGYAAGMLLVVPLGDSRERRGLILTSLAATIVALALMAAAPTFATLVAASALVGFATCTPQLIVPFAAALAPPEGRARAVGFVMSGLLAGILLARSFAGFVGEAFGWRAVYLAGMAIAAGLAVGLSRVLPKVAPPAPVPYGALLRSVATLVREEGVLRRAMVYGASLFAAFSAFWTTLGFHLQRAFGLGSAAVGWYALLGVAGALAPSLVGRRLDAGGPNGAGPRRAALAGIALTGGSFAVFVLGRGSLLLIAVGVLLLDVGTQCTHISNQSRIYGRRPESRSRMNTAYMTAYFVGGALGSAAGAAAWQAFGWYGVGAAGAAFAAVAGAVFSAGERRSETPGRPLSGESEIAG